MQIYFNITGFKNKAEIVSLNDKLVKGESKPQSVQLHMCLYHGEYLLQKLKGKTHAAWVIITIHPLFTYKKSGYRGFLISHQHILLV